MRHHIVPALLLLFSTFRAGASGENAAAPDSKTIAGWAAQLNADRYESRETATQQLIAAGAAAVEPVCQVVQGGNWEVTTRGIFVLQELSLAREAATEQAAMAALERLSALQETPQARRAAEALSKLDHLRRYRAIEIFTRLGATINQEHVEPDMWGDTLCEIQVGPDWRGEESDLRRLKWLSGVSQVTFAGDQVRDSWFTYLRGMESLRVLKVKRAPITDAALADLKDVSTLGAVKLLYLPIGDPSAEYLAQCPRLKRLKLIGTRVTPAAKQKLTAAFGAENVDCRRGAFLGITPSAPGTTWFIMSVLENSAAEHAGLLPGDVIVKYAEQKVPDFESLTRLIAQNDVGDTVQLEILRDGRVLAKSVTFGGWE